MRLEDLAEVRERLKKEPQNPRALRLAGRHYLSCGNYKSAYKYFSQALLASPHFLAEIILDFEKEIAAGPEKIGPRLSLAGFKIAQNDVDGAILELEEAIELIPKDREAYNILGKILVKQGELDKAIALLERSLLEGIKDVSLAEILAGAYLEKGRLTEAIKFYREILEYRPADKQTLRVLGELYSRLEDYDQAAESYRAMFSEDPEVGREVIQRLEALLKVVEGSVFIREILAEIYMRSLNPEEAVAKLLQVLRLDATKLDDIILKLKEILKSYPGHPQATLVLAEALRRKGSFSEAVENYYSLVKNRPEFIEAAMAGYQEVLAFCPQQILARTYLAEAFLYKKQIEPALAEFEKMVGFDPTTAEAVIRKCREIIKSYPGLVLARLVLGRAYLALGDWQRAAVEAEGILAIDKNFIPAYLLLGEACNKLKLSRKAVEVLGQALAMDIYNRGLQEKYREAKEKEIELEILRLKENLTSDPWRLALHLDLAKLYVQQGLKEEAVRHLQLAMKDGARAPAAANLLGCVYRSEGRFDLAAKQFSRALELATADLADFARTARFNLGTTFEAQGLVREALKIYEGILQEDIDFTNLKKRVKYLKATSLKSMRTRSLVLVVGCLGSREVLGLWGREGRSGKGRQQEMNLSFGQNHNNAGFEYFMKGMFKAALEEFQLAVQLDARFAIALNNLAVVLAKEGKLAPARVRLEEALAAEEDSLVFHNNLGVVNLLLGNLGLAKKELENSYCLDEDYPVTALNLGDAAYLLGETRQAIDLYNKIGAFDVLAEVVSARLAFKTP